MRQRTKALALTSDVREKVWHRDLACVYCGSPYGMPNAHYISRGQGGLGTEENILTLCADCHRRYDQTAERAQMREFFKAYLKSKYPEWDEKNLVYRRI